MKRYLVLLISAIALVGCASSGTDSIPGPRVKLIRVRSSDPQPDLSDYQAARVAHSVGPKAARDHLMNDVSMPFNRQVVLEVEVLVDGTVGSVLVTKGIDPIFDDVSVKTVRQWRFRPTRAPSGKPVDSWVRVHMSFVKSPRY